MTYIEEFKSIDDVRSQYQCPEGALDGANVLLAWYGYGDYCGSSFVLYEKDGKLYEVNGSHCSCNGLEGQWEPAETDWATMRHRATEGYNFSDSGGDEVKTTLLALVETHERENATN